MLSLTWIGIFLWFSFSTNFDFVFIVKFVDPKTREEKQITVSMDDGIRPETSISVLAKLKPAFKKDGSTTAGIKWFFCIDLNCYQLNIWSWVLIR